MQLGHALRTAATASSCWWLQVLSVTNRGSEQRINVQALAVPTAAERVRQGCTMLAIRGRPWRLGRTRHSNNPACRWLHAEALPFRCHHVVKLSRSQQSVLTSEELASEATQAVDFKDRLCMASCVPVLPPKSKAACRTGGGRRGWGRPTTSSAQRLKSDPRTQEAKRG